jgi:hypothetical protein
LVNRRTVLRSTMPATVGAERQSTFVRVGSIDKVILLRNGVDGGFRKTAKQNKRGRDQLFNWADIPAAHATCPPCRASPNAADGLAPAVLRR